MEELILNAIDVQGYQVTYDFSVTNGLKKFFTGKPFVIEYPMCLDKIPQGILAVPFVSSVLPIIWLTDSKLSLPELDQDFLDCIPNVKQGYEAMFPESRFAGEVCPQKLVSCPAVSSEKSGMLFSGGLDATQTLVSHFDENPHLISIWGSDILYDNEEGWNRVYQGITEIAHRFDLPSAVIRSSFRLFDSELNLDYQFMNQLQDGWWHGVKHSLALLGLVAPYAYAQGLSRLYIGSSNCPADGAVRCASHPSTDNHVRFASCQVMHDGFEFSRQDKIRNVVYFSQTTGRQITLHVCWQSQTGTNCCHCEKCYRTMAGILAEGADPAKFGLDETEKYLPLMQAYIVEGRALSTHLATHYWAHVQNRILRNRKTLKKKPYWKYINWIAKADLANFEKLKMPLSYRIRTQLSQYRFYQMLHQIKERRYDHS